MVTFAGPPENDALPTSLDQVEVTDYPPLVLTAFTRPDLLEKVLPAIRQQTVLPSRLIAFIDGARRPADQLLIEQCVAQLQSYASLFPVDIIRRDQNLGCDQNVIQGFTEVFKTYPALIYLEDDTVPNPYFYDRIGRLLTAYEYHSKICSVSAYANLAEPLNPHPNADMIVSNRVFSWGFGTWRDRWHTFDLAHQSGQYNPFGQFHQIPLTAQTKRTFINQFWLEKNHQTDWMITFTLAALFHRQHHLVPRRSLVYNIGFGHPESKTYRGAEADWVNARYDAEFCPHVLPPQLELGDILAAPVDDLQLIEYLFSQEQFWLNLNALLSFLKQTQSYRVKARLMQLYLTRLPLLLRRWRNGQTI